MCFVCMCVCVYVCVCVFVCVCVCVFKCVRVCVCIRSSGPKRPTPSIICYLTPFPFQFFPYPTSFAQFCLSPLLFLSLSQPPLFSSFPCLQIYINTPPLEKWSTLNNSGSCRLGWTNLTGFYFQWSELRIFSFLFIRPLTYSQKLEQFWGQF